MKIQYLDGIRLYRGLLAGSRAVIGKQEYLNKINVFPVADSDTGINLAMTLQAILERSHIARGIHETLRSVADSALTGARGNSGIIFAQYLHGLSRELPEKGKLTVKSFAQSSQNAVKHLYDSLLNPVEGTMLTVIREWSDHLMEHSNSTQDFWHLLTSSLATAQKSLKETPKKLKMLADAGVVDAGASGFVYFMEGLVEFIHKGSLRQLQDSSAVIELPPVSETHNDAPGKYRWCTEAILSGCSRSLNLLKGTLADHGDSLILAGDLQKLHIHIHTNDPDTFFARLFELGEVSGAKVDDMLRQYQTSHDRKYPIGLVTDTACDLPQEILDKYQISRIPFGISFGMRYYLDKLTIGADRFYSMLRTDKCHPISSQPAPATVRTVLDFTAANFERVITVHISERLSGAFQSSAAIAAERKDGRIGVINSRHLSVSEGLVTLRIARAIEAGMGFDEIMRESERWIANTKIYTDINTLKYMVRGGRVKPLTGIVAALLNLKPIVSLDSDGKALALDKSLSRSGNMRKISAIIRKEMQSTRVWEYAIVHADDPARAEKYSRVLSEIIGKDPAYIMPLSPVVGVHNGIGAIGIGVSYGLD